MDHVTACCYDSVIYWWTPLVNYMCCFFLYITGHVSVHVLWIGGGGKQEAMSSTVLTVTLHNVSSSGERRLCCNIRIRAIQAKKLYASEMLCRDFEIEQMDPDEAHSLIVCAYSMCLENKLIMFSHLRSTLFFSHNCLHFSTFSLI